MNLDRVLDALLRGAVRPPRRRRRTPSILGGRTGQAQLGRALATIATAAIEAMTRGSPAPQPPPAPPPPRRAPAPGPRVPQTGSSPWSRPAPPAPTPVAPAAEDAEALLLVRAMVAAAQSDGAVDAEERRAIAAQLDAAGLDAAERDFVLADFERPLTPEALARAAHDPMLRARLYAAGAAVVGDASAAERRWLDSLAAALRLDPAAAHAIEEKFRA